MTLQNTRRMPGAFTLIELLVVILIIAVMSAVVIPAFAGYLEKSRFDAEIRRLQDYFALAREKAVKCDTNVALHFDHGIHQFSIAVDPLPPATDMPTAMLTGGGADVSPNQETAPYRLGDDYQVEDFSVSSGNGPAGTTQTDVRFHGDGTSDGADLEVVSRQGYTAHLTLSPMNGRLALRALVGTAGPGQ